MPTVLIGGGSGLIGSRLSQLLSESGYTVWHLSRTPQSGSSFPAYFWDAEAKQIDQDAVDAADFIINLAGAGIADKRWTDKRKAVITGSRVDTTLLLRDAIRRRKHPLKAFLSASGQGYYGSRGDQIMTEADGPGQGFLPKSCIAWEAAVAEVAATGVRTVILRAGVVLSVQGGALPKMTFPLYFFAGIYFGNGRQWMSWIHIDDLCRMHIHAMETEALSGIFNAVAPVPVHNRDFIARVAAAKNKPVIMAPAPAFALRLALGELAHTVLDSTRVSSQKIEEAGFVHRYPVLEGALADVIARKV